MSLWIVVSLNEEDVTEWHGELSVSLASIIHSNNKASILKDFRGIILSMLFFGSIQRKKKRLLKNIVKYIWQIRKVNIINCVIRTIYIYLGSSNRRFSWKLKKRQV
jgi:hypothetical protein